MKINKKQIKILNSKSRDDFLKNIEFYVDIFLEDGVFALRDANFTYLEQKEAMINFGSKIKWFPNNDHKFYLSYKENHANNFHYQSTSSDDVIFTWHLEHLDYENPIIGATWNMIKFSCMPNAGKTLFLDMSKVYSSFDNDWKDFLSKCTYKTSFDNKDINIKCLQKHWNTKEIVYRHEFCHKTELALFNESKPSQKEIDKYKKIVRYTQSLVNNNSLVLKHQWKQGDIVFVDLFKMAHSVTGGFDPKEREFIGLWARETSNYASAEGFNTNEL